MPNIPVNNCCGCTACYNICHNAAIQMLPDDEGFLYPVIDRGLCTECGRCEKVCPIINKPEVYKEYSECVVAQSSCEEVLNESTSGGFIDALCKHVIDNNGYAVGVTYNQEFLPIHTFADSYEDAKEFRNSKYAQSDMSDIFKKVRNLLSKDVKLVFVGTPCQIAGLKSFLSKDYENLITVDLVCRSIPSPKLWRKYLDYQENRYKSKVQNVVFRKKTYGYHSGALEIKFKNGKSYAGSNRVDYYMKSFHNDICSRPSCYNCQFKTKHRCSDFTVFDSWEPQSVTLTPLTDNDRGYSNVLVHTEKAKSILYSIKDIKLYKADPEKMFFYTGGMESASIEFKKERVTFYSDVNSLGFSKGAKKYISVSLLDHIVESIKPLRYFVKKHFKRLNR